MDGGGGGIWFAEDLWQSGCRFVHADGDVYEGEWAADTAHGRAPYGPFAP